MAKQESNTPKATDQAENSSVSVVKKRVCEVCGEENDEGALMCKMCSNYLED